MLQCCYSGVTIVLQWCYNGVRVVLQSCYSSIASALGRGLSARPWHLSLVTVTYHHLILLEYLSSINTFGHKPE
jgi:hypothetical protein